MNLQTLTIFLEVMKELSFTGVANKRNLAPSSISRAVSNLELELGLKLFQRSTRSLKPTEAGVLYYERVSTALSELDVAKQVAKDSSNEPRGVLRVTASTVFGQMYVVPMLPVLFEKYPLLEIELILTDAYIDLIEERIDVSIRLGTLQDSSYISKKLSDMTFSICASPQYIKKFGAPKKPHDIKEHNCLLFPRGGYSTSWLFLDSNRIMSEVLITGNCTITNSDAIKQSTLAGVGISLLPNWLVEEEIKNNLLVNVLEDYEATATDFNSAIWLLYPSRDYVPLKAKVFIDHLVSKFR